MREAPGSIETMLQGRQLTLARCVKFVLRDGFEMGFTDHDEDLVVPVLGSDQYGAITYKADRGLRVGEIDLAVGLDADNTEMGMPFSETIGRAAVLARRFNHARVFIFDADWSNPNPDPLELMAGRIAEARAERNMAVFEVRSQADYWNTVIGSILSPRCRADFGDVKCGATPTSYTGTVTESISNMRFVADVPDNLADDYFRFGEAEFITGGLAGTWPYEIVTSDGYGGEIEVLSPMPGFPEVGDRLLLRNGCSRVKTSTDPLVPTCLTHNNVRRFRGFDQVPGTDRYIRPPIPGEGDQ